MIEHLDDGDGGIARWAWSTFGLTPMKIDWIMGILDARGDLVGAAMLHGFNGANIEVSFYGPGCATTRHCRTIARVATRYFRACRLTAHVHEHDLRLRRWLPRVGAWFECVSWDFYGRGRHAARFSWRHEDLRNFARDRVDRMRTPDRPVVHDRSTHADALVGQRSLDRTVQKNSKQNQGVHVIDQSCAIVRSPDRYPIIEIAHPFLR